MAVEMRTYLRKVIVGTRKRKGFTLESFADKVSLTAQAIRDFESGKTKLPHDKNWQKMLEVLELPAEKVMSAYMRGVPAEELVRSVGIQQQTFPFAR